MVTELPFWQTDQTNKQTCQQNKQTKGYINKHSWEQRLSNKRAATRVRGTFWGVNGTTMHVTSVRLWRSVLSGRQLTQPHKRSFTHRSANTGEVEVAT